MPQHGRADKLKFVGWFEPIELFTAFSPALESSEISAAARDLGLTVLRADGRFETIMEKYGLSDWARDS